MPRRRGRKARSQNNQGSEAVVQVMQFLVEHLIVIRESGQYGYLLLDGMIQQTFRKLRGVIAEAEELERVGIDLFQSPSKYDATYTAFARGDSNGVLLFYKGLCIFIWAGSAALGSGDEAPGFVSALTEVVEKCQPRWLHVAEFTRLVRSGKYSEVLLEFLKHRVAKVDIGGMHIEPASEGGSMMWSLLTAFAKNDRDSVVRRTSIGRLNKLLAGKLYGGIYPPGYGEDGDGKFVLLNTPENRALVEGMMEIICFSDTAVGSVPLLGDLGWPSAKGRTDPECGETIGDLRSPYQALEPIYRYATLYTEGVYVATLKNPFPGIERLGGCDVIYEMDSKGQKLDGGHFEIELAPGMPPGGWSSPQVAAGFASKCGLTEVESVDEFVTRHDRLRPLSGLWWSSVEGRFRLTPASGDYYRIELTPCGATPMREHGFDPEAPLAREGEPLALVQAMELHESIYESAEAGLELGLPTVRLDMSEDLKKITGGMRRHLPSTGLEIARIKSELTQTESSASRARRNANEEEDEVLGAQYRKDARRYASEARALHLRLEQLEGARAEPIPICFSSDSSMLLTGLGALVSTDGRSTATAARDFRTVFSGFEMEPSTLSVRWRAFLLVPGRSENGTDQIYRIGPITGIVPNRLRSGKNSSVKVHEELLRLKFCENWAVKDILDAGLMSDPKGFHRLMNRTLAERGVPKLSATILGGDIPDSLRRAFAHHLFNWDDLDGLDPDWVQSAISRFIDPTLWLASTWQGGVYRIRTLSHQRLVDAIAARGGRAAVSVLARDRDLNLRAADMRRLTRTDSSMPLGWQPILVRHGDWSDNFWHEGQELEVVPCANCGSPATIVDRTPVNARCLLCGGCGRTPELASPVYPEDHRTAS